MLSSLIAAAVGKVVLGVAQLLREILADVVEREVIQFVVAVRDGLANYLGGGQLDSVGLLQERRSFKLEGIHLHSKPVKIYLKKSHSLNELISFSFNGSQLFSQSIHAVFTYLKPIDDFIRDPHLLLQIRRSLSKQFWIISKIANSQITVMAQEFPYFTRFMVMIYT
jgi:hypothetical protein